MTNNHNREPQVTTAGLIVVWAIIIICVVGAALIGVGLPAAIIYSLVR